MSVLVCIGVLLPFPFYCFLWTYPQIWVDFCGKGSDPCHRMAQVSHFLKILQFLALFSVAHFSWPPWYCFLLFALGQFLNFRWVFSIWVWLGMLLFGLLVSDSSPVVSCWVFSFCLIMWIYSFGVLCVLGFASFDCFFCIELCYLMILNALSKMSLNHLVQFFLVSTSTYFLVLSLFFMKTWVCMYFNGNCVKMII